MSIRLEVVHGDVLNYPTNVLALKYAQNLYGVDAKVVSRLASKGINVASRLPEIGKTLLLNSEQAIAAHEILFIGVQPSGKFDYETIRNFAHSVLRALSTERPSVEHVAMTLHGIGFGLDEAEAFRSEIAGVLDAVDAHHHPRALTRISIVERDAEAAQRLIGLLAVILPSGIVTNTPSRLDSDSVALRDARAHLGAVGHDSRQKPHVFVAMPFAEQYADRFHYGIRGAADAVGFLCERADLASFTGDILEWVKGRIASAALVVADLTAANPNVYLEVGYAWGRGVRTVLVVAVEDKDKLGFDLRTQRCLVFSDIRHLEQLLTAELRALKAEAR